MACLVAATGAKAARQFRLADHRQQRLGQRVGIIRGNHQRILSWNEQFAGPGLAVDTIGRPKAIASISTKPNPS
ncbi:hypothetical protein D9M68_708320 [compost metagenome]